MGCDDFLLLSMAWLDDEMDREERAEFERHLAVCRECRTELEQLRRVKEVTTRMKMVDLEDREWDAYWGGVYNRLERNTGWVFLSIGVITALCWAAYSVCTGFLFDSSLPLLLRIGIFTGLIGFVVLLVSVGRQRLFAWKRDPYRRVKR